MSGSGRQPDHRDVRVRRSPKVGVFLGLGALAGAVAALVIVGTAAPDPSLPAPQAFGGLVLALGPIGALLAGAVAVVLDRRADRRARVVRAERTGPDFGAPPSEPQAVGGVAAPAVEAADAAEERRED